MEISSYIFDPVSFFLGLGIGLLIGVITSLFFRKNNLTTERVLSLVIFTAWLCFHIIAFVLDKNVAWIFDAMGAGATGSLIGINFVETLSFLKGKNGSK